MATFFVERYRLNKNLAASNRAVPTARQAAHDTSETIRQVAEDSPSGAIFQLPDKRELEKRVPEVGQNVRIIPRMGTRACYRRQCLDPDGRGDGGNVGLRRVGTNPFRWKTSSDGKEPDPEEADISTSSAYNTGCTTTGVSSDSSELENRLEVSLEISSKKSVETTISPKNFDESLLERGPEKRHETEARGNYVFAPDAPTPGNFLESESSVGSESDRFSSNQKCHRCHVTGTAAYDRSAAVTCVDVMYTNRANLEQTMLIQQGLLYEQQQQLLLRRANCRERLGASGQTHRVEKGRIQVDGRTTAGNIKGSGDPEVPMEWMVRKRSDGTRYIAKRPRNDFKATSRRLKKKPARRSTVSFTSSDDDDVDGDVKPRRLCRRENAEVARSRHGEMSRRRCVLTDGGHCYAFDATGETHFSVNENSMPDGCLDSGQRCNKGNVNNNNTALLFVATF